MTSLVGICPPPYIRAIEAICRAPSSFAARNVLRALRPRSQRRHPPPLFALGASRANVSLGVPFMPLVLGEFNSRPPSDLFMPLQSNRGNTRPLDGIPYFALLGLWIAYVVMALGMGWALGPTRRPIWVRPCFMPVGIHSHTVSARPIYSLVH